MSAIKPHALGLEKVALYHVLKILESQEIGYPPELADTENPVIREARVTLVFELAFMAAKCIIKAIGGFKETTIWMNCENAKPESAGSIAYKNADAILKDSIKIKSKYYNSIKILILGDLANPNKTNEHTIEFNYSPIGKVWLMGIDESTNIGQFLLTLREEFLKTQLTRSINFNEMAKFSNEAPDIPSLDKFKYYLQQHYHTGSTTNNRKHFLSSSQHWWLNFTNILAEKLNELCTQKSEQIIIRFINKDHLNSAMKNKNQDALSLNDEIERLCKSAYKSNNHLGALGQNPKEKFLDREWFINKICQKAREQDEYIETQLNKPEFHHHPDYENFFSLTPYIEQRHIQTVTLSWIFAKYEKEEFNFHNPLSFIRNDLVLEKIISLESLPSAQQNDYINKITSTYHKNNPPWPEIAEDLHEFLFSYIHLLPKRRLELYKKIIIPFLKNPESIEEWLHLPINTQDPVEFISTRPSEEVAKDLMSSQKDGDFTGALIANSLIYKRFIELKTKSQNNTP